MSRRPPYKRLPTGSIRRSSGSFIVRSSDARSASRASSPPIAGTRYSFVSTDPERDVYLDPETGNLQSPKKLGSRLKIKRHRPLEGTPKTAHLVTPGRRPLVRPYRLRPWGRAREADGPAVGLDVGLIHFVADSDGNTVENPRCFKSAQQETRGGRSVSALDERKGPTAAERRRSRRRGSTSRSHASARTTPTNWPARTSTPTPSSPSKTFGWRTCSRTATSPTPSLMRVGRLSSTSSTQG